LHQNAFGGQVPPGPTGRADTVLPRPPSWILGVRAGKRGKGRERKGRRERRGEERKGGEKGKEGGTGPPAIKSWLRAC